MQSEAGWGQGGVGWVGSKKSKSIPASPRGAGLKSCPIPALPPLWGRKTCVERSRKGRVK